MTETLTDFLLSRIAEDEAVARAAQDEGVYPWMGDAAEEVLEMAHNEGCAGTGIAHFRRHNPARVLARCKADRRIVEACAMPLAATDEARLGWDAQGDTILRILALSYVDRADYQQEWGR